MSFDKSQNPETAVMPTAVDFLRSTVKDVPAWGISFCVHAIALIVLASITLLPEFVPNASITSVLEDIVAKEEYAFDSAVIDPIGSEVDMASFTPSQAFTNSHAETQQQQFQEQIEQSFIAPPMPLVNEVMNLPESDLQARVFLEGDVVHTGGVSGVMDRLTFEIATSLRERQTLVIWLFDVSPSVSKRRNEIADRFENVYKQLGLLDVGADVALKTGVVSFGEKVNFVTKDPVSNVNEVADAIRQIDTDLSGDEYVFTAAWQALNRWEEYRTKLRHNVLLIIVTDEAGSDQQRADQVINLASRNGIRCFCVGNEAPFGRQLVEIPWSTERGEKIIGLAEQGPETAAPERLRLDYWGRRNRNWDREQMSSGFGPYTLSRLAAETGGTYFITEEIQGERFDAGVMRDYAPRYEPAREFERSLKQNSAKVALIRAAAGVAIEDVPQPRTYFESNTDTVLRQGLTQAQQPIAEFDYKLNELLAVLKAGEGDRDKIVEPRWQAGYDLAMGRVLAMHARAYGYNVTLAEMKGQPKKFETQGSNAWKLVESNNIQSGPAVQKMAAEAVAYLRRVVEQHPGTPWHLLAERELSIPMGWEWREATFVVRPEPVRPTNTRPVQMPNRPRPQPPAPPKKVKI